MRTWYQFPDEHEDDDSEMMNPILKKKAMVRHKFRAKPVVVDGHFYPSTAQARYKAHLDLLVKTCEVLFYLEEVPLRLPEGEIYRVDFIVFYTSGEIKFTDVKGFETREFLRKKKLVEKYYPITIEVVKSSKRNFK